MKIFSRNNINSSFQQCPLDKTKCNLNDIFHAKKGTLLPEKGHFGKLGGAAPDPPQFRRP